MNIRKWRFWWIGGVLGLLVLGAGVRGTPWFDWPKEGRSGSQPRVIMANQEWRVEIAATDAARAQGLAGREALCENCAMLFLFEETAYHGFWMKDMRFPLDIVWLLEDEVVHIERAVPADSRAVYRPTRASNRVVEVTAGGASGLRTGDRVEFLW